MTNDFIKLSNAKIGDEMIVHCVCGDDLRSQLLELGVTVGRKIRKLYAAPMGDPIAVDVEGFVLSLRKSEADLILVVN